MSDLIKKQITDKNGRITHRWVKPDSTSDSANRSLVAPPPASSSSPHLESITVRERGLEIPTGDGAFSEDWRNGLIEDIEYELPSHIENRRVYSNGTFDGGYLSGSEGLIYWSNPASQEVASTAIPHGFSISGFSTDPVIEKVADGYNVSLVTDGFDPEKYEDYSEYYDKEGEEGNDNSVLSFSVDEAGYWRGSGTLREFSDYNSAEEYMNVLRGE